MSDHLVCFPNAYSSDIPGEHSLVAGVKDVNQEGCIARGHVVFRDGLWAAYSAAGRLISAHYTDLGAVNAVWVFHKQRAGRV